MFKRFLEWIGLKERLHTAEHKPPFFREGELWWCHVGENIGNEINGKGDHFTRPIYIFKKYDRYSMLGLPLTTKEKDGTWYAPIEFRGQKQRVVLSQGRVFDYRRLKEKMGELGDGERTQIREMYFTLHQIK
jgi:mRNA interferase MazF